MLTPFGIFVVREYYGPETRRQLAAVVEVESAAEAQIAYAAAGGSLRPDYDATYCMDVLKHNQSSAARVETVEVSGPFDTSEDAWAYADPDDENRVFELDGQYWLTV